VQLVGIQIYSINIVHTIANAGLISYKAVEISIPFPRCNHPVTLVAMYTVIVVNCVLVTGYNQAHLPQFPIFCLYHAKVCFSQGLPYYKSSS